MNVLMLLVVEKTENVRISTGWTFLPHAEGTEEEGKGRVVGRMSEVVRSLCFSMSIFAQIISSDLGIVPGI